MAFSSLFGGNLDENNEVSPIEPSTGATSGEANRQAISLADFDLIRVIGRGSYAKVLMVELKNTKRIYAMKVIKKELVTDDEVRQIAAAIVIKAKMLEKIDDPYYFCQY